MPIDLSVISAVEIRDLLRAMDRGDDLTTRPLSQMSAITRRLARQQLPDSPATRELELRELLRDVIFGELDKSRGDDKPQSDPKPSDEAEAAQISRDIASGSTERGAWSALYFRYFGRQGRRLHSVLHSGVTTTAYYDRLKRGNQLLAEALRQLERQGG